MRRDYGVELNRLFQLALTVPERQASNQRVFMDKGEFNKWLFEVMNTGSARGSNHPPTPRGCRARAFSVLERLATA